MTKFDTLIEEVETYEAPVMEHCKVGEYYGPFNALQTKILREFYEKYLRKLKEYDFGHLDNTPMMMMFIDKFEFILKYMGEDLCKEIPDEKTLKYTGNDIKMWARKLFDKVLGEPSEE